VLFGNRKVLVGLRMSNMSTARILHEIMNYVKYLPAAWKRHRYKRHRY